MEDKAFKDMVNKHAKTLKIDITEDGLSKQDKNRTLIEQTREHRWPQGQSGNPTGRPRDKKYISEAIRELLANDPELLRDLVLSAIREAKSGNIQAFKEIADRGEGKVVDVIDQKVSGELFITPTMRAIAAREMIEVKEEEVELLTEGDNDKEE